MAKPPSPSLVTPLFSISQTASSLTLAIRAPHSRPHDIHVSADGPIFTFFCNPYALHLSFEHPVYLHHPIDAPPQHTTYDFTTGIAHVTLRKTFAGTHFHKLDLLNTLLQDNPINPTDPPPFAAPSIQVLSSTIHPHHVDPPPSSSDTLSEHSSLLPSITRTLASLNEEFASTANVSGLDISLRELALTRPTYGFASRYEAIFRVRAEDASQIVLLPNPDATPVWRRPALRKAAEDAKFDPDHYIADFLLEHEYAHVFDFTPNKPEDISGNLNELPRREYLPDVDKKAAADLAGILFASAYDQRITSGERNVESPWTISRLSPTMAFLEQMQSPREALLAAYRRSLAYPLYRSVKLANRVVDDVKAIFDAEVSDVRQTLLSTLMELRSIFEADQLLRLHCDLFLIDYCIWIQTVDDGVIRELGEQIKGVVIERLELEWNLDSLESRAVRMANGEEIDDEEDGHADKQVVEEAQHLLDTGREVPRNEIRITAHSNVLTPGLVPVRTTKLKHEPTFGPPDGSSTSSEYDSDSTCTTASTDS